MDHITVDGTHKSVTMTTLDSIITALKLLATATFCLIDSNLIPFPSMDSRAKRSWTMVAQHLGGMSRDDTEYYQKWISLRVVFYAQVIITEWTWQMSVSSPLS